jgi:cholesterol transport system auxiliary component
VKRFQSVTRLGVLAIAVGLLTACSTLPSGQAVDVYRLPRDGGVSQTVASRAAADETPAAHNASVLRVVSLNSGEALNTTRIVVIVDGDVLSSYRGARWSDPAPELIRARLVQAFAGNPTRIIALKDTTQADLELGGELEAFQSEYRDGKPMVRVRLNATLVDVSRRRVVAVHRFEVLDSPSSADIPAIIKAFGRATEAMSNQVVDWALHASAPA